jgi:FixJ family two-component response regulator
MAAAHGTHVAVIEDDDAMRLAIRRLLSSEGYLAEVFASAESFLASGGAARARCLVLDIRLPGMSGVELFRLLRAQGNDTPTIFISAHDSTSLRDVALGARDCRLAKPFPGEALIEAVARSLAP